MHPPLTETSDTEFHMGKMGLIVVHISMFLSFFQLFYHVSERGISVLLAFLKALLL